MPRRIFVDTEWTSPPWQADCRLMWIGLADEDGNSWHGISAEAAIDPATNPFVAGAFQLISPQEPRLSRPDLAAAVIRFCGAVDEFWAWIPTQQRFAEWFGLGDDAPQRYQACRDVDLQMLRAIVQPWPATWPTVLHDLNARAVAAGVDLPPRAANHLHPRVHAAWNRALFDRIQRAPGAAA